MWLLQIFFKVYVPSIVPKSEGKQPITTLTILHPEYTPTPNRSKYLLSYSWACHDTASTTDDAQQARSIASKVTFLCERAFSAKCVCLFTACCKMVRKLIFTAWLLSLYLVWSITVYVCVRVVSDTKTRAQSRTLFIHGHIDRTSLWLLA